MSERAARTRPGPGGDPITDVWAPVDGRTFNLGTRAELQGPAGEAGVDVLGDRGTARVINVSDLSDSELDATDERNPDAGPERLRNAAAPLGRTSCGPAGRIGGPHPAAKRIASVS